MSLRVGRLIERGTLLLLLLWALGPRAVAAQACPADRYCFYVPPGLPLEASHSGAASRVFDIVLSSPIRTVAGSYSIAGAAPVGFTVAPGSSVRIALTSSSGPASAYGTPEQRGVFLVADSQDLTVDHRETFDQEQYSETIKRHSLALGSRFRLGGYSLNREGRALAGVDAVLVYAPSGATVTLTAPPGATLPFWSGSATAVYTTTLSAGQTIAVRTEVGRDLDGGLLTSTAPVSVSSGGRGWSSSTCGDDGMDGLVPVSSLGTEYVARLPTGSYAGNNESRVRVIADVDATEVRVNGALVATLAAGTYYSFQPTALSRILTSQPALVWMNGSINGCELDTVLIPPVAFAPALTQLSLDFNVLASTQTPPGELAVLIATADVASIRLNGAAPTLTSNETVPQRPDLSYVRFNVAAGDQNVRAGSDFQAMLASRTAPSGLLAYYNPYRIPGCGDSGVDPAEGCDDGGLTDGDGCSSLCQVEPGWSCSGAPSVCATVCGDSSVAAPIESCDDGNATAGDGCNSTCRAEVRITSPADASKTSNATPTISGTADVGAIVSVAVGPVAGTATADASGVWSFTPAMAVPDGLRVVTATAVDARGGNSSAMRSIDIDTTSSVAISAPSAGSVTNDSTPTIRGTGEIGATVQVSVDGASIGSATVGADGSWELTPTTPLAAGMRSVSAVATDLIGNTATATAVSFTIDAGTTLAITAPADGARVGSAMPTIRGTGEPGAMVMLMLTDAMGGAVNASATVQSDGSWSVAITMALATGSVAVVANAADAAGNMARASSTFIVDAATFVMLEAPLDNAVVRTALPVISGTGEPGATVTIQIDMVVVATAQVDVAGRFSAMLTVPLTDAAHTVRVDATDLGGNSASDQRTFTVDTGTRLDISRPLAGETVTNARPEIAGTGEVGASVEVSIDGNVIGTVVVDAAGGWRIVPPSALADGPHRVAVRSTDPAGNEARATADFSVATRTRPLLIILNPPDGARTRDAMPTLSGFSDPAAQVSVAIDGVFIDTITSSARGSWSLRLISPLSDGMHTVFATTTDAGGITVDDQHTFIVDTRAPAIAITAPAEGGVLRDSTPFINGTGEPGARVQVLIDGMARGDVTVDRDGAWSLELVTPLPDGRHSARAVATDAAQNSTSVEVGFFVDTSTAVIILLPADNGVVSVATPTIAGVAEPRAMVALLIDGMPIGTVEVALDGRWSMTLTTPLTLGMHRVTARSVDSVGNQAMDEHLFTYDPNARERDSDGDGRSDSEECGAPSAGAPCRDSDGDGLPDPMDADDDGDGLPTAIECVSTPCLDSDGDGRPDYLDPDDDDDGRPTFDERGADGKPRDNDLDGLPDHLDPDDDNDSIPTREECAALPCPDTDGDATVDYLDPDDDNDGVPTARERADGMTFGNDPDGDGLPSWRDPDANGNGANDGIDGLGDRDGDRTPDYVDLDTPPPGALVGEDGYAIAGGGGCNLAPSGGGRTPHALIMALLALLMRAALRRRTL